MPSTVDFVDRYRRQFEVLLDTAKSSEMSLLAAAIAFYTLLSVIPLIAVIVALATIIGGERLVDTLVQAMEPLLTDEALEIVETGLAAGAARSSATVVGLIILVWGALRVYRAIDRSFNAIYGEPGFAGMVRTVRNAVAVFAATLGILFAISIAATSLALAGLAIPAVIGPLIFMPVMVVVLLPMYVVFPPLSMSIKGALPGAAVAAVGITVATAGMQLYVAVASPYAVYGVIGGIFLAMTWFYVIALVILFGAVVNAVDLGEHRQVHDTAATQEAPK